MSSNKNDSTLFIGYKTVFLFWLKKNHKKSRPILKDGSRFTGPFWKRKKHLIEVTAELHDGLKYLGSL